jgi:hypothetical protein
MSKRAPRPARPSTLIDPQEAAIREDARQYLRAMRSGEGDPFSDAAPHEVLRHWLKDIADCDERNTAFVVKMAISEMENAHEALAELISERGVRGEPLGPALTTYVNMLSHSGRPRVRPPEGRTRENFVADFAVVLLLIYLQRQHGLKLRRGAPTNNRPSACSIAADVLRDEGVGRGGEERVRKVWERYGPPAIPTYRRPPPPGVVRFIFH